MEVKKYNSFVAKPLAKSKTKPKPRGAMPLVPQALSKVKTKHQSKTKLEARGLSLENKEIIDIFYAKGFVKTSRK